jgi:hypothetical protein
MPKPVRDTILDKAFGVMLQMHNRLWSLLLLLLLCGALVYVRGVGSWRCLPCGARASESDCPTSRKFSHG